jgi:hypothetical protein
MYVSFKNKLKKAKSDKEPGKVISAEARIRIVNILNTLSVSVFL